MNIRNLLIIFVLLFFHSPLFCVKRKKPKRAINSTKELLEVSTLPSNARRELEAAIVKGDTNIAKQLLNSYGSALANACHSHEAIKFHTLASYALGRFQPAILRLLLKAGARPIDSRGESLLFNAVYYAQAECTQVLLEDGYTDPNVITITPNPIISMSGSLLNYNSYYFVGPIPPENTEVARRLQIARALLDHGADRAIKDKSGRTAIEVLIKNQNEIALIDSNSFYLRIIQRKK